RPRRPRGAQSLDRRPARRHSPRGAHLRGPQRLPRRRRRAPPASLLAAPRRRRPRRHHRGLRRPELRRHGRPDARPRLNPEEDVMPLRRLLLVLGVAMLGLLPLTYSVDWLAPLRVPALLGLVLTLGLWALALIAGDAPLPHLPLYEHTYASTVARLTAYLQKTVYSTAIVMEGQDQPRSGGW